ncbi:MAG: c-type cytochrome [Gemmatimonadales bacterium]|nr:c-type cytochrome [Gemmatimonadales bacterium]
MDDLIAESERGKQLVSVYGCVTCHEIRGLSGNPGDIGPPLTRWKQRKYIAGRLPNDVPNLILWLRNPQEVNPGTAMPDLGVSKQDALDMSAYLYSQ